MKYNPKINEVVARFPGFAQIHPLAPPDLLQGALALLYELERALAEISGMEAGDLAALRRRARRVDRLDVDPRVSG